MDKFKYNALIVAGYGGNIRDKEITVEAETFKEALTIVENKIEMLNYTRCEIFSIRKEE